MIGLPGTKQPGARDDLFPGLRLFEAGRECLREARRDAPFRRWAEPNHSMLHLATVEEGPATLLRAAFIAAYPGGLIHSADRSNNANQRWALNQGGIRRSAPVARQSCANDTAATTRPSPTVDEEDIIRLWRQRSRHVVLCRSEKLNSATCRLNHHQH